MSELPPLNPITEFTPRPVSLPEYYHACVGTSAATLDRPRDVVVVIEGQAGEHAHFNEAHWQLALNSAAAANPGARMRWVGKRHRSHYHSDGKPPRLRLIKNSDWDGQMAGSDFIFATPLLWHDEPCAELILVEGKKHFVILRTPHAVMDGVGAMHFLQEVFRALQGKALLGTNADFSDADLMRSVKSGKRPQFKDVPPYATGGPRGAEHGESWRLLQLPMTDGQLFEVLPMTILAVAGYAQQMADDPARPALIALPVNLRRHRPGLLSTANFASMVHFPVNGGDSVAMVQSSILRILAKNIDADLPPTVDWFKHLPLRWMDWLVSRRENNYQRKRILETAVVSYFGRYHSEEFSSADFHATGLYIIPTSLNTMLLMATLDNRCSIAVSTENIYATDGRLDELTACIRQRFSQPQHSDEASP